MFLVVCFLSSHQDNIICVLRTGCIRLAIVQTVEIIVCFFKILNGLHKSKDACADPESFGVQLLRFFLSLWGRADPNTTNSVPSSALWRNAI